MKYRLTVTEIESGQLIYQTEADHVEVHVKDSCATIDFIADPMRSRIRTVRAECIEIPGSRKRT